MKEDCILIVEDDAIAQLALTQHLRDLDIACSIAVSNGKDAIKALDDHTIVLAFLDIHILGEWDGIDTARRIHEQQPGLPLVFLTASIDRDTVARLQTVRPYAVISKPYDRQTLYDTLQGALNSPTSSEVISTPSVLSSPPELEVPAVGVSFSDARGVLVAVNPAFCSIHGCTATQATGRMFTDYFPEDIRRFLLTLHREFMEGATEEGGGAWTIIDQQGEPHEVVISISRFSPSDDQRYKVSTFVDTDRQQQSHQALQGKLEEKDTFVREAHHRLKNHLNVSAGLLYLQANKLKDQPEVYRLFQKNSSRLKAMAMIHEQLCTHDYCASIDLSEYLPLLTNLLQTTLPGSHSLQMRTDISPIVLDIDQAVACGLIVNEVVTNSITYAFVRQPADAMISIEGSLDQDTVILTMKDNGVGLPESMDWEATDTLGAQLIKTLTEQLNGWLSVQSTPQQGVSVRVTFPHKKSPAV